MVLGGHENEPLRDWLKRLPIDERKIIGRSTGFSTQKPRHLRLPLLRKSLQHSGTGLIFGWFRPDLFSRSVPQSLDQGVQF